ncbi:MAG: hypothetical protein ACTSYD_08180 [Candidatus Heimdallarchaeaceae archaeon]
MSRKIRIITRDEVERLWDIQSIVVQIFELIDQINTGHYDARTKRITIQFIRILMKKIRQSSEYHHNIGESYGIASLKKIREELIKSGRFNNTGIIGEIDRFLIEMLI